MKLLKKINQELKPMSIATVDINSRIGGYDVEVISQTKRRLLTEVRKGNMYWSILTIRLTKK